MNFFNERRSIALNNWENEETRAEAQRWHDFSRSIEYQYMFQSCGIPIIQDPQDICMVQEIIWKINPTLIIETGIARGGSLMLSAMSLAALSFVDGFSSNDQHDRRVIGIDIDIRTENRNRIESHPLFPLIRLIEGSSTDVDVISKVKNSVKKNDRVLVILDSNHTEEHVFEELEKYADFVTINSAILVMDTGIEFAPESTFKNERPWSRGANPYTATKKFLETPLGQKFIVDREIEKRHLISCAPEGLLVRLT
jgi:cephalosporin hydroxylase